jgi:hypothetical protein
MMWENTTVINMINKSVYLEKVILMTDKTPYY